jgi:hypothetical protein
MLAYCQSPPNLGYLVEPMTLGPFRNLSRLNDLLTLMQLHLTDNAD